jgi:CHASE2 domain-containing sensor protein
MPEKDPANWSLATYGLIVFWAVAGGLISFYGKVQRGVARWFNVHELIGECATSAFVGLTTGLVCQWAGTPIPLTFALVGVAGHAGARGIFILEQLAQKSAERKLGVVLTDSPKDALDPKDTTGRP